MAGIIETKEMIGFGVGFGMAVDRALEDGFDWTDLFSLVPSLTRFPEALNGADEILDELYDMDEPEKAELVKVIEELELKSEKSEELCEQSLIVAVEIAKLILMIRGARKEE